MIRNTFFVTLLLLACKVKAQIFKHSIEGGVSLVSSYRILTQDNSNFITIAIRDDRESPLVTYGAWATTTYYLNKRVFVNTGIRFTRLGYRWKFDTGLSGTQTSNQPVKIITDDIYNIVSLPLNIGYSFVSKENYSLQASGGIFIDGMMGTYIKTRRVYASDRPKTEKTPNSNFTKKGFNFSYNFCFGAFIKLTYKNYLKTELMYYRNINSFNTDHTQLRLLASMLNLGYVRAL